MSETGVNQETPSCFVAEKLGGLSCQEYVNDLYYKAYYDQLTGLPNELKAKEYFEGLAEAGIPMAVFQIDVRNFGVVNTRMGHQEGDGALIAVADGLRTVAANLSETLRANPKGKDPDFQNATDVIAARLHGDEMMVIVPLFETQEVTDQESGESQRVIIGYLPEDKRAAAAESIRLRIISGLETLPKIEAYNATYQAERPLGARVNYVVVEPSEENPVSYHEAAIASDTKAVDKPANGFTFLD